MAKTDLVLIASDSLEFQGKTFRCATGFGGIRSKKREGDGATPVGSFSLRQVFYRSDRLAALQTALPVQALKPIDGWCDEPDNPCYNTWVQRPFLGGHEVLWRNDALYDLIIVVGHNDQPVIPGHGSAIFIHIARPSFSPTAGCVAFAQEDLLTILRDVSPESRLVVPEGLAKNKLEL